MSDQSIENELLELQKQLHQLEVAKSVRATDAITFFVGLISNK